MCRQSLMKGLKRVTPAFTGIVTLTGGLILTIIRRKQKRSKNKTNNTAQPDSALQHTDASQYHDDKENEKVTQNGTILELEKSTESKKEVIAHYLKAFESIYYLTTFMYEKCKTYSAYFL